MEDTSRIKFSVAASEIEDRKAPVLYFGDFVKAIDSAAKNGFDAIEIHLRDPRMHDAERLNKACELSGMKISGIATGMSNSMDGLSLIDDFDEGRKAAISRLKSFVDLAAQLDASILVGRMKDHIKDFDKLDYYEGLLADSMLRVGEYAEGKNVKVMLEAINRYESNYRNTVGSIGQFISKYKIPSTYILADTFHMNIEEKDLSLSIKENFSLLGYVHFADSNRQYPGCGHTDFKPIYRTLCQLGYAGYIGIECLPVPHGNTAAKQSIEYIKSIQ